MRYRRQMTKRQTDDTSYQRSDLNGRPNGTKSK